MNNNEKLKQLEEELNQENLEKIEQLRHEIAIEDLKEFAKSDNPEILNIVSNYIDYAKKFNKPKEDYVEIMENLYSNEKIGNKIAYKLMNKHVKNGIDIETDPINLLIQNPSLSEKQKTFLNDIYVEAYKKSLPENHLFNQLQEKVEDSKVKQLDEDIASIDKELEGLKVQMNDINNSKTLKSFDEKIIDKIEIKKTNLEVENKIDNFIEQVKIENSNKQLDSSIDGFINQVKIEDTNKKVDIKINDYVESVKKAQSYDDFLKSKENGTYVPYVEPVKEKKIEQPFQSYDDYLKKNQEKIDKLDNQNTQIVKKYVEVVKLDVPKESVEEQIQFNKEKEKVANLMLESFKINYMAEKGLKEIKNHNDFLNFMEDKFITKISNLDDEDLKYKVHNDFEILRDRYIKDNKVDRQHNPSSKSKDFLDDKNKYLAAHATQEVPDISIGELIF